MLINRYYWYLCRVYVVSFVDRFLLVVLYLIRTWQEQQSQPLLNLVERLAMCQQCGVLILPCNYHVYCRQVRLKFINSEGKHDIWCEGIKRTNYGKVLKMKKMYHHVNFAWDTVEQFTTALGHHGSRLKTWTS